MRALLSTALIATLSLVPAPARADVQLTIMDGYVSLEAKNATVRQILEAWARVGQTRIVNAERVTGTPVTLHLVRVPEAQALDILLRHVSGYMAAPRAAQNPTASQFDRILVMPTSVAPRVTAPSPQPQPQQPAAFQPPPIPDDVDMDEPVQGGAPARGPIFPPYQNPNANPNAGPGQFPQRGPVFPPTANPIPIQGNNPNANPTMAFPPPVPQNAPFPGVAAPGQPPGPVGTAAPGMMVAPPAMPGTVPQGPQE